MGINNHNSNGYKKNKKIYDDTILDSKSITRNNEDEIEVVESNRQKFRNLPVIPSILSYIEKVGVGLPPRGKKKWNKRRAILLDEKKRENIAPPPPFASTGQHYIVSKWRKYIITRDPIKRFEVKEIKIKEDGDGFIMPEIALAGRSNVGKSTLLNALLYSNIPVEKLEEDNNYQYKYNEAYHNSKYN